MTDEEEKKKGGRGEMGKGPVVRGDRNDQKAKRKKNIINESEKGRKKERKGFGIGTDVHIPAQPAMSSIMKHRPPTPGRAERER